MKYTLSDLGDLSDAPFDDIIDVRSPAEFAQDHVPGAINLPVLNDAERAEVGTIYKQVSPFAARVRGAALVSQNAATHLQGALASKPGDWRVLVYCWRGGQRSGSFATILGQIGWRVGLLEGGYRSFRRLVVESVHKRPLTHELVVLDGNTGTAKTRILQHLAECGVQVIDLEGLAGHRGSIFGLMPGGQPSQKQFEARVAMALSQLDPARPVVVEAESNRIGKLGVPPSLWAAMKAARRIEVTAPIAARAAYLVQAYADLISDPMRIPAILNGLVRYHGHETVARWQSYFDAGRYQDLAAELMSQHYDPRYKRARSGHTPAQAIYPRDALDEPELSALAAEIAQDL